MFKRLTNNTLRNHVSNNLVRNYVSRTNTKNTTINSLIYNNNSDKTLLSQTNKNYDEYFNTLPRQQLLSLLLIGLCSLNNFTLKTAITIFPYIPLSWVRILVSNLYCGGETITDVLKCGTQLQNRGISNMMLSLTIENSEGNKIINNIDDIIKETIHSIYNVLKPNLLSQINNTININDIAPGYIALKPSALVSNPYEVLSNYNTHPDAKVLFDNCDKITNHVFKLNKELSQIYPHRKVPFFITTIDAEKFDLQMNGVYQLQRDLMKKYNKRQYSLPSVIGTWQLYLADSLKHIQNDVQLAENDNYTLGLKIVRGAYLHSEPNRNTIIFNNKHETDTNYNNIMNNIINDMITKGNNSIYSHLVIASHNMESQLQVATLINSLPHDHHIRGNITLGQLLGMADNVAFELVENHSMKNVIKYVPWGPTKETRDYLLRRLQENGDAVRSDNGWGLVKRVLIALFK